VEILPGPVPPADSKFQELDRRRSAEYNIFIFNNLESADDDGWLGSS
jgi:hypothetical protein